jgi:hypothetical protein
MERWYEIFVVLVVLVPLGAVLYVLYRVWMTPKHIKEIETEYRCDDPELLDRESRSHTSF